MRRGCWVLVFWLVLILMLPVSVRAIDYCNGSGIYTEVSCECVKDFIYGGYKCTGESSEDYTSNCRWLNEVCQRLTGSCWTARCKNGGETGCDYYLDKACGWTTASCWTCDTNVCQPETTSCSTPCGSTTESCSCTNQCGGIKEWTNVVTCRECVSESSCGTTNWDCKASTCNICCSSPYCGQGNWCGGNCGIGDCNDPTAPTNLSPLGTEASPVIVTGSTIGLTWADPTSPRGFDTFPIRVWDKTAVNPWTSCVAGSRTQYCKEDIVSTVHSFSFPPAGIGGTLTPGHRYRWWIHAYDAQNCSGVGSCPTNNGWSPESVGWFCRETASCSPACGQAKDCVGNCVDTDNGSPAQVTIVEPNGTSGSPTVISDDTTIDLSWNTVLSLTDRYEVEVYDSSDNKDWSNYGISGAGTSTVTTGTLALGDVYHWRVRAVNVTCNAYGGDDYGTWSAWGYFKLNRAPVFGGFVLRNSDDVDVAVVGGQNHVCQTTFMNSSVNSRVVRFVVSITDGDGGDDVDKVYFRLRVDPINYLELKADDLNTSPIYSLDDGGVGGATTFGSVTTSVSGNVRTVYFPVLFDDDFSGGTFRIYDMQVYGEDIYGSSTGWQDTSRDFKVWDCQVDVTGGLYDSSACSVVSCAIGAGFTQLADMAGTNFFSLDYVDGADWRSMTLNADSTYASGSNDLIWNSAYLAYFNGELDNDGLEMADPKVNIRVIDLSVGDTSCISGGITFNDSNAMVDPYSDSVEAQVDFTAIANQDPWFQARNVSVLSEVSVNDNIPITCYLDILGSGCTSAVTIDYGGMDGNGIVLSSSITNNSGCVDCEKGIDQDWWQNSYTTAVKDVSYGVMYKDLFVSKGVGVTYGPASSWSDVVTGVGGTGLVFYDGDLAIDADNTVAVGDFLMVVVDGSLTVDESVNNVAGAFVVTGNIVASGDSVNALLISGPLYAGGNIVLDRGFVDKSDNNVEAAVKVDFRPDLIFNAPSYMLTSYSRLW